MALWIVLWRWWFCCWWCWRRCWWWCMRHLIKYFNWKLCVFYTYLFVLFLLWMCLEGRRGVQNLISITLMSQQWLRRVALLNVPVPSRIIISHLTLHVAVESNGESSRVPKEVMICDSGHQRWLIEGNSHRADTDMASLPWKQLEGIVFGGQWQISRLHNGLQKSYRNKDFWDLSPHLL